MALKRSAADDSIISAVRAWLNDCELLSEILPTRRHIDWTDSDNENYGIFPDGDITMKKFINGGGKHRYDFTLCINKMTAEDEQALRNAEFIERLQRWCRERSLAHELPELPGSMEPTRIEAECGMLTEIPQTRKYGKYIIPFKLFYME